MVVRPKEKIGGGAGDFVVSVLSGFPKEKAGVAAGAFVVSALSAFPKGKSGAEVGDSVVSALLVCPKENSGAGDFVVSVLLVPAIEVVPKGLFDDFRVLLDWPKEKLELLFGGG